MKRTAILLLIALLGGCAASQPRQDPFAATHSADGSVTWEGEYRFTPPPAPWQVLSLDEEDYSVAFFRGCQTTDPGTYPCESTMAYAEEPFGYSRRLEERQREFFRRFLWAARIDFDEPHLEQIRALGGAALRADTVGHERVLGHKVLVRAVFAKRAERVVAFYFTQWRPDDQDFDRSQLENFNHFLDSFSFTRASFYERML